MYGKYTKLCPVSFGFAWGLVCALFIAGFAWIATATGHGKAFVDLYATFYYGYEATFMGGAIGGLWGFLEGFLIGFFVALFYNFIMCCCKSRCCCQPCDKTEKCCDKSDMTCKCTSKSDQVK
ncbi:MAG TPA: hypothetical protein VHZ76_05225 [Gammaproteobacteria bacterium]|nr:hypothetical protein [Gammaproteobacteria bacterium]